MAATWANDIFKCNIVSEDVLTSIKNSLNFVSTGRINNMQALVQIMAWRWSGNKPLSEPMMALFTDANMRHLASVS